MVRRIIIKVFMCTDFLVPVAEPSGWFLEQVSVHRDREMPGPKLEL